MARADDIEGCRSDQSIKRLSFSLKDWSSLPLEVQDLILAHLPLNELFKARPVCRSFEEVIERRSFHQARARLRSTECSLSPLVFYAEKESWHLRGFDWKARIWRTLPPFRDPIPAPDLDLFKDFHVAGDKGLFCVNVGKASEAETLYVCNPLTGVTYKLPALEFSRHPVIISMHATLAPREPVGVTSRFWVVAIGSAAIGSESLSRKTEVYHSVKGKWEAAGDVPGADFSLNDYQTGVYCESLKLLLCVGPMVNDSKGILAFDVEQRKWRENWICPFYQLHPVHFHAAKLIECSGRIYLFSEQEAPGRNVTHCIDRLNLDIGGGHTWTRVVTQRRKTWQANRLLLYNEYTCVPLGENKLCIFNTFEPKRPGVVYDMLEGIMISGTDIEVFPSPGAEKGVRFQSLSLQACVFEPRFCEIATGSAAIGTESLSRKAEVYNSVKGKLETSGDLPGTDFSLNDYQTGVYCMRQNLLLCVGFMVNGSKCILAFDVEKRRWREDWIFPSYQLQSVTDTALTVHFASAQLVVCRGRIYLFSEQEAGRNVTHCIDRLDLDSGGGPTWTRVVTRQRQGNRALLVYPEYTCVPMGENKLCIFNTIEKTGVVYDMQNDPIVPETYESLPPPSVENGIMFHSLNPVGYAFEPSFGVSVPADGGDASTNATDTEESLPSI